jgi:hypothetical protein
MTKMLPIFPLPIVAFPTEDVRLHIFEPRYIQMVNECWEKKKEFVIVTVIDNKLMEYGTSLEIIEIRERYEDGKMDIVTKGRSLVRLLEVIAQIPGKMFHGAIVHFEPLDIIAKASLQQKTIQSMLGFHQELKVTKQYDKPLHELTSYDVGHHVGFTVQEEYRMLTFIKEIERMEYIHRHLATASADTVDELGTVNRIRLNGKFRELNLDDYLDL